MSEEEYEPEDELEDEEPSNPNVGIIKGSASLIADYQACPAKAFGRITRQEQPKGFALVNGIAIHEALEKFIKEEADPIKTYESTLRYEAERNKVALDDAAAAEGHRVGLFCIGAGVEILKYRRADGKMLYQTMDPDYVERGFSFVRNGRTYRGKIDFVAFQKNGGYVIGDWKSGKNAPSTFKLKTNIQFSMYDYALHVDPDKRTNGKWMTYGTYVHLRGQSEERDKSGRRKPVKNSKPENVNFSLRVNRTPEQVESHFVDVIEPVMSAMEQGVWFRNYPDPCSWCGFYNKVTESCNAKLPHETDQYRIKPDAEQQVKQLPDAPLLIDTKAVPKGKLKPYN